MPVRVALQELEAEGVLDLYPHRGAVIRGVDARFVRNMLELRAAVEVMLTERCARLIDKAGMAELNELAQEFEAAAERKDSIAVVNANLRLHHAINRVADNPEAMHVLGRGRLLIQALRVRFGYGPGRTDTVIAEVDYTLPEEVEALQLVGFARSGTGNAGDNTLVGTGFADARTIALHVGPEDRHAGGRHPLAGQPPSPSHTRGRVFAPHQLG